MKIITGSTRITAGGNSEDKLKEKDINRLLTRDAAFKILEIDGQIEWLMFQHDREFNEEIEELKKQKILIYDNCNRL